MPPAAQVKLLRALQEGEVEPVGARKPVKVDVRIISATNRDLIADVKSGRFREDLFYRLHVFPISVPPLRQRSEDIPELARHFLARLPAEEGKRVRAIEPEALRLLDAYRWPGNVRQLENAIFRAVVLTDGEAIGVHEFPQITAQIGSKAAAVPEESVAEPAQAPSVAPAEDFEPDLAAMTHGAAVPASNAGLAPLIPGDRLLCSTPRAKCDRWTKSNPISFGTPLPITGGKCRKSRGGCRSAVRPSIASSKRSA